MSDHYDRYNGMENLPSMNLAEVGTDLISRAAAQTELQLSARRYTVAHEAHGEGRVVWSEDLISVSDAMDVLRKIPSAEPTFDARDTQYNLPIGTDLISRQQVIKALSTITMYKGSIPYNTAVMRIEQLPSAQLDTYWKEQCQSYEQTINKLRESLSTKPEIIYCKDCKHHWTHKCMDSMPIERCDLEQTFYDAEHDFCSLAERREVTE